MSEHVGDEAELYPVGLLAEDRARNLERHISTCTECAVRVRQAEAIAASFAATLPEAMPSIALERRLLGSPAPERSRPFSRARSKWLGFAVAAVLALAFVSLGWQTLALRTRVASDDFALATLVHSHFEHVTMTPQSAAPVAAKILYARDGSWLYVIADDPKGALRMRARTGTGMVVDEALSGDRRFATLFLRTSNRVRSVVLERRGAAVAVASLVYEGGR